MKTVATLVAGIVIGLSLNVTGPTAAAQQEAGGERTAWYFYRVTWGHQDEFLDLFVKNHWPVLKAQLGGRLTDVKAYVPTYHGDGRADWTFATALTFRDANVMVGPSPEAGIVRKLFPDQSTFLREEARRFEILDAHWDVPLTEIDLDARPARP